MSNLHIYAPSGYYIGQTREYGHKLYCTVTKKHSTKVSALKELALKLGYSKRGRILFCAEWYEPNVVLEIVQ
jgi:hypothetical protein